MGIAIQLKPHQRQQAGRIRAGERDVVLLGATVKALGLGDLDWDSALEQCVKPKFLEMNKKAFKVGLEA